MLARHRQAETPVLLILISIRSLGYPLVSLIFHNSFDRTGHTDQFSENIDAVMYQKALNHQVRIAVAGRAQVEGAPLKPVRTRAALLDHSLRRESALGAELKQYIESLGNLIR